MTVDELIIAASHVPLSAPAVEQVANAQGATLEEVCDLIARTVAERYRSRHYSWEFADMVMTNLFSFGCDALANGLPKFALLVHEAFDEGEWLHGSVDQPEGQARTDALLEELFTNGEFSPTRWRNR